MVVALLNKREAGMSLVELLVAMSILAVVILSVVGLFTQSITLNASGMDYTRVNDLSRDKIEELLGSPFNSAALAIPDGADVALHDNDLEPGDPYRPFDRTWEVRQVQLQKDESVLPIDMQLATAVPAAAANLKVITVNVASRRTFLTGKRDIQVTALRVDGLRF